MVYLKDDFLLLRYLSYELCFMPTFVLFVEGHLDFIWFVYKELFTIWFALLFTYKIPLEYTVVSLLHPLFITI